jgi:hypothetical protein
VIFFTENDVIGGNKPIYHVERVVQEMGTLFNDGEHIIYVNGSYEADTPLGWLVHDFKCTDAKDMHYKELANRVRYFKETEKGVAIMSSKAMEIMRNEAAIQASIKVLKRLNVSDEKTVAYLLENFDFLSEEEAKKLISEYED